jgi:RNA polymerase subunit RPABC4/transcription elongation factor Spt4
MIQCQNCGQVNTETSNFCRFCGTKFLQSQMSNQQGYEYAPPRAYSWKTNEFQVAEKKPQKTQTPNRVQPLPNPYSTHQSARPQPLAYQQPNNNMAFGYRCPRCASQAMPNVVRKISPAGWIVFAVLLVMSMGLFCWIGLLIKEDVRLCPACGLRIN